MKKIGYLISLAMLLLIPGVCNAETNTVPKIISDIKVENVDGEEKSTINLSFKVLKDLDFTSDYDYIDIWANTSDSGSLHLHSSDGVFKTAQNGSCEDAVEITDNKIKSGSIVCASKEVAKNVKINNIVSIGIQYFNNHVFSENTDYDVINKTIVSSYLVDETYKEEIYEAILKHYGGYLEVVRGDYNGFGFAFVYDPSKGFDDTSVELKEGIVLDNTKNLDYYIDIIDSQIAKAGIKFDIKPEENKVEKNLLSGIKVAKQKVEYETKKDDKIIYSWVFDGAQMEDTDFNIDLSLKIGESTNKSNIEELVKDKEKPLVLEFGYHGGLPKGTSVKVNVADTYDNDDVLSLYYYNDKKELELIYKDIKVENGFATLKLEHCSEYVLVKNEIEAVPSAPVIAQNTAPNNAQTSSLDLVLYSMLAIGSLFGIVCVVVKNKKKVA